MISRSFTISLTLGQQEYDITTDNEIPAKLIPTWSFLTAKGYPNRFSLVDSKSLQKIYSLT